MVLRVPKRIWTYWDSSKIPECVHRCMAGWRRLHPGYEIHFVRPDTVSDFADDIPPNFHDLGAPRQSDWVRLFVLRKHGGIWMDASIILTKPLDWVVPKRAFAYRLKSFQTSKKFPVIESWFLACVPGHPFFEAWFAEFDMACRKFGDDGDGYLRHLKKTYGTRAYAAMHQNIHDGLRAYLTIHITAQKIMQQDGIRPIETAVAEDGPFALLVSSKWNEKAFAKKLLQACSGPVPEVIKLRSDEREALTNALTKMQPHPSSVYALHLATCKKPIVPFILLFFTVIVWVFRQKTGRYISGLYRRLAR